MISEKEILEFLDESRWVPGLPDLSILKRHVGNLDDADRKILCSLIDGPQDIPELVSAATLIWHLNAGGRRHYRILTRPDKQIRSEPRPDFVLADKVTGRAIALEVTQVFHPRDEQGPLPLKRRIVAALKEWLYENRDLVPTGSRFHVVLGVGSMRGLQFDEVVRRLAIRILRAARKMKGPSKITLADIFEVVLEREGLDEESLADFYVEPEEDHRLAGQARERFIEATAEENHSQGPIAEWSAIPTEFLSGFNRAISEAEAKFDGMPSIARALLITLRWVLFPDQADAYVDHLRQSFGRVKNLDRLYLRYTDDLTLRSRIRRVW